MLVMDTGTISTTTKLKIQSVAVESAATGARIGSGAYSVGSSQGSGRKPQAKKKLQRSVSDAQPSPSVASSLEDKEADGGHDTGPGRRHTRRPGQHGHRDRLTDRREQQELAAAKTFDEEDGDERGDEVGDAVEAGEEQGEVVGATKAPASVTDLKATSLATLTARSTSGR